VAICADENILWFEIPVYDARNVETFYSFDNFCSIKTGAITT
jgi:hypothetical protein